MLKTLVACALALPLTSQQTWVVDYANGPDVDFTDFPQAVLAAAPGDTIFVARRISSLGYTAAPIDKPLRIVGFQRATQVPDLNTAQLDGLVTISGIAAGEQVVLSGITIFPQSPQGPQAGLEVLDCAGQILLENCYVSNAIYYAASDYRLRVTNCADVVFRDCDLYTDGVGVELMNANVTMTRSIVQARWNLQAPPAVFAPAMTMTDSTATLVGSWVWSGPHSPFTGNTPGAILYDSTLRVGPDSLLQGSLLVGGSGAWFAYQAPIADSSVVEKDARGTLAYSQNLSPPPTPAPIDAMYHGSITANYAFWMTVYGPIDGFALLALGEYGPPVPTPFGDLRLQGPIDLLEVVPLSSDFGYYDWTLFMPSGAPSGVALAFQCLTLSPTGEFGLTESTPFAIAWELQLPPP